MHQSQLAVELLRDGTASTADEAQKYAKMIGGAEKLHAEGIGEVVRAKLEEAKATSLVNRLAEKRIAAYDTVKGLKDERVATGTTALVKTKLLIDTSPMADLDGMTKEIVAKVGLLRQAYDETLASGEQIFHAATLTDEALRKIVANAELHDQFTRSTLAATELMVGARERELALTQATVAAGLVKTAGIDPRADVQAIAAQLLLIQEKEKLEGAVKHTQEEQLSLAVKATEEQRLLNASLAETASLREHNLKLVQMELAKQITRSPGFNARTMDPAELAVAAQQKVDAAKSQNVTLDMGSAVEQAQAEAEALRQVGIELKNAQDAVLSMSDVWEGFHEKVMSTVPLMTQVAQSFADAAEVFRTQFGDAVAGVILGFNTAREAAKSLAQTILRELIQSLVAIATNKALEFITGRMHPRPRARPTSRPGRRPNRRPS